MADTSQFNTHPQPRTFAPSKEDVLQNLQYFFGAPVSRRSSRTTRSSAPRRAANATLRTQTHPVVCLRAVRSHAVTYHFPDAYGQNTNVRRRSRHPLPAPCRSRFVPLLSCSPRHAQQPHPQVAAVWQTSVGLPFFQITAPSSNGTKCALTSVLCSVRRLLSIPDLCISADSLVSALQVRPTRVSAHANPCCAVATAIAWSGLRVSLHLQTAALGMRTHPLLQCTGPRDDDRERLRVSHRLKAIACATLPTTLLCGAQDRRRPPALCGPAGTIRYCVQETCSAHGKSNLSGPTIDLPVMCAQTLLRRAHAYLTCGNVRPRMMPSAPPRIAHRPRGVFGARSTTSTTTVSRCARPASPAPCAHRPAFSNPGNKNLRPKRNIRTAMNHGACAPATLLLPFR